MTEELLPEWTTTGKTETGRREEKSKKREQQHTTWEQWSLWDQFGSTGDIIQVALMDVIIPTLALGCFENQLGS